MTTAECDVLAPSARAMPENTGKPKTTPRLIRAYAPHSRRGGRRGRRAAFRQTRATTPAITARPMATSQGSNPRIAKTVAGKEPEKARTPRKASAVPRPRRSGELVAADGDRDRYSLADSSAILFLHGQR